MPMGTEFISTVPIATATTGLPVWEVAFIALTTMLVGVAIGVLAVRYGARSLVHKAKDHAQSVVDKAQAESQAITKQAQIDGQHAADAHRVKVEAELAQSRQDLKRDQQRLDKREDGLESKAADLDQARRDHESQVAALQTRRSELDALAAQVEARDAQITATLSEVSGLSQDEARDQFMVRVEEASQEEATTLRRTMLEAAEHDAKKDSREITLMAIQRFAGEHVAESTLRSVKITSEDMKGRVIGREGRNIRAIERATGADVLVDDTPGVISVSCFDPIRRAIAGEALQRLVDDGRVHPSRIEEIVEATKAAVEERIKEAGEAAVVECSIRGLHPKIAEAMGKLHFRTSYGQNVLRHSVEVASLSQVIADQLGLDGALARRCGFLHDIGKAMDHEVEGGHPAIGMEFARRYGEKDEAVLNAIGGHHGDIDATTPYTPIVMAADALSGARPGARRESMEHYVQRLRQLEGLATENPSVREAYAVQAGREVRVIVDSGKCSDNDAFTLAEKIAVRVEEEMTFPGEIKVTVLRETRAEATAR
ncbi:MAG: ribonuclease Y [Phycisphaerales bacterium]|nr:ribonuclease Y [Phycisphaerales bacterium]